MIFNDVYEWSFYEGLKEGIGGSLKALSEHPRSTPLFATKTAENCSEAFSEGYIWGMELSLKEYNHMMKPRIRIRARMEKKAKVEEKTTEEIKDDVIWN